MKTVRKSVFETNSSSVHSLSISRDEKICTPNYLNGYFGEFGWGYEILSIPEERLSYLLVALANFSGANGYNVKFEDGKKVFLNFNMFKWTDDVVFAHTGSNIVFNWDDISRGEYYPFGYIDHQSVSYPSGIPDVLSDFWSEEKDVFSKNIEDFIFNDKYVVEIDNDNH